jgi:threonine dehydratase
MKTDKPIPVTTIPTADDIIAAYEKNERLHPEFYHKTPIITSSNINELTKHDVYFKLECMQKTGSFKIRGNYNLISDFAEKEGRDWTLYTASAGNHAQGFAASATLEEMDSVVVMPELTPNSKIKATERYGAKVIIKGKNFDDSFEEAKKMADENNKGVFISPFGDSRIIAGHGTVGLEIEKQIENLGAFICPIGGGGLISGSSIYLKSKNPKIKIIGVQTDLFPAMDVSYHKKERVRVDGKGTTIAEGIAVEDPGELPFEIICKEVDEIVTVSEQEIARAIVYLNEIMKVVPEGAGAVPLAALISNRVPAYLIQERDKVCCLVSGGNIDLNEMEHILNLGLIKTNRRIQLDIGISNEPAALIDLLKIIDDQHVRVIELNQDFVEKASVHSLRVRLTCDIKDKRHKDLFLQELSFNGYNYIETSE